MTIVEFLLARIAEDEAWANAAVQTPGASHWHWVDTTTDVPVTPDPFTQEDLAEDGTVSLRSVEKLSEVTWDEGRPLPDFAIHSVDEIQAGVAGHIVRHDPARVLAECESKRRIMAEHPLEDYDGEPSCWTCAPEYSWGKEPDKGPCVTLRSLALPYADHPDYEDSWRA